MMTSASSLAFPGSKTLAGWWRQLTSHRPLSMAVAYLFLHRVEAPVVFLQPKKIDRFSLLVLQALKMDSQRGQAEEATLLERLQTRLHLERQVVLQVLRALQVEGLAGIDSGGVWSVNSRGLLAIKNGEVPVDCCERRTFHFLERCDPAGVRSQPPCFLNLRGNSGTPWQPDDAYPFDVALLRHCLDQPEARKQQFGFPVDVRQIPDLIPAEGDSVWQRVIVDRPERRLLVLALAAGQNQPRLLGFSARQEGWVLSSTEPVLVLDTGWQEIFPELSEPSLESCGQAWQSWAKPRGLSDSDIAGSVLHLAGHRLRVTLPRAALDHLRNTRSEVFKGDTWLLIGDGRVRCAVNLELVPQE
jgi:hypothetical protein